MEPDQAERQIEELQVIQAIYMDDYIDHTKSDGPADFSLKLIPLQSTTGKDVHARLELRVLHTTKYPDDPPVLKFENAKGISDGDLNKLKEEVNKMALELAGEVMILQLAQHIQAFLHIHNKPNLSFFDQMVANQMKQEEIHNIEQKKIKDAKVAEDRENDQDVIRQVKEQLQKRTEEKRKRQISISQSSPHASMSSMALTKDDIPARKAAFVCSRSKDHQKLSVFNFKGKDGDRKVFCSSCFGHYYDGACTLMAIEELSGNQVTLMEWKLKLINLKKKVHFTASETVIDTDAVSKQLQSIEQEFNFLKTKLLSFGLLNYHCLDIDQNSQGVSIKLLTDPISGPCLSTYLQEDGISLSLLQSICKQIVDVLLFMHNKSVVHHDLNLFNTFINTNNEVTLSGYAVVRRISDLYMVFNNSQEISQDSSMPFGKNSAILTKEVKKGKKGDIFNLGLILLSLYLGHTNIDFPINIPDDLPDTLKSFLTCCLAEDEDKRSTTMQLSNHSFVCMKILNNPTTSQSKMVTKSKDGGSSGIENAEKQLFMPIFRDTMVQGKSRLINEFDSLEWLGKGGFGSVIKVKNKLDGNMYALKRIRLNPNNLQLNKRITREVKLLSRLNHENVVRYYNSWIEADDIKLVGETSMTENDSEFEFKNMKQNVKPKKLFEPVKKKDLEELLQQNHADDEIVPETATETEMSSSWCEMNSTNGKSFESSSSSSDSDDGVPSRPSRNASLSRWSRNESSEGIIFNDDSMLQFGDLLDSDEDSEDENTNGTGTTTTTEATTITTTTTNTTTTNSSTDGEYPLQCLYIQMEYCEKSTLRIVIDDDIWKEQERVARYFREIVEGLTHVHAQGIIHRDLKPFNIFLDSKDRIKIGDFGLATSHTSVKETPSCYLQINEPVTASSDRMTGKVGTALYVAPELGVAKSRIKFSQKVDMYSLGIILFEMCYKPLATGMERVKTLGLIRSEEKILPEDFPVKLFARERFVIMWLLNHSPDDRPTAQELLESGYVPPKIEDSQLDELLKHTLSQNNSTRYQRLMSTLFNQTISPVNDQIYDSDYYGKSQESIVNAAKILQHIKTIVTRLFDKHGGIFVETPLLTPKSKFFESLGNAATFMDQNGMQLCLPYDSRLSFARYLSRNNVNSMRRYYFGKLYRDQRIMGHPASLWECSFDIVSECYSSLLPVTELIYMVCEIIREFPNLVKRNFYIRLNHSNIINAIFLQNNFSEDVKKKIIDILNHTKNKNELETQLSQCLSELGLQDHIINRTLPLLTFEGTLSKAKDVLQGIRKTKAHISNLAKQAFSELDKVVKHLANLNVDIDVHVCTFLTSNIAYNSGIIFQFVAENTRKKKHGGVDILALGGCYNQLIESMSKYAECSSTPTAVGVSIAVEKLLIAVAEECKIEESWPIYQSDDSVIVCSITNKPNIDMLLQVLCELWSSGISATLFSYELNQDYTVEEIQDFCKENFINYFVVLKDSDMDNVRVRVREKEKFTDSRVSRKELCDYLKQKLSNKCETTATKDIEQVQPIKHYSVNSNEVGVPTFLFTWVATQEQNNKKRIFESKFEKKFQLELAQCFGSNEIQVVAARLEPSELRVVAAYLELKGSYDEFDSSVQDIVELYQKKGPYLKRLCNTVHKVYTESQAIVILFSFSAEMYKVFI